MHYSAYRVYSSYSVFYSVYSAYRPILINSANTLVYSAYSELLKCSYSVYIVNIVRYSDLFKSMYSVYSVLLFRFKSSYSISRLLSELNLDINRYMHLSRGRS